jgi:hypothetical protein
MMRRIIRVLVYVLAGLMVLNLFKYYVLLPLSILPASVLRFVPSLDMLIFQLIPSSYRTILLLFVLIVVPFIIMICGLYFAISWWRTSRTADGAAVKAGIFASFTIGLGLFIWYVITIIPLSRSLALLSILFLPFYLVVFGAAAFLLGWSVTVLVQALCMVCGLSKYHLKNKWVIWSAMGIVVLFAAFGFGVAVRYMLLNSAKNPTAAPPQLTKLYNRAVAKKDIYLLVNLAGNPASSEEILRQIYSFAKSCSLQDYYRICPPLAENRRTPADMLKLLASDAADGVRVKVALNPNTPVGELSQLSEDKNNLVRAWLCVNPNITKRILLKLKDDPDEVVRNSAESSLKEHKFSD